MIAYKYTIKIGQPRGCPMYREVYSKHMNLYDVLKDDDIKAVKWENPTADKTPTFVEVTLDGLPTGKYFSMINQEQVYIRREKDVIWGIYS